MNSIFVITGPTYCVQVFLAKKSCVLLMTVLIAVILLNFFHYTLMICSEETSGMDNRLLRTFCSKLYYTGRTFFTPILHYLYCSTIFSTFRRPTEAGTSRLINRRTSKRPRESDENKWFNLFTPI